MIPFWNCTFYIESYGCTYNHADAEKLAEMARAQGCTQVDTVEQADVVVINTCTVVASTERAMLRRLGACAHKNLVVTGCMPVVQMEAITAVSSPTVILPDAVTAASGRIGAVIQPGTGVLQVAKGCLGSCSYCITRFARGRLASFSESAILAEAERLIAEGACELQLTGQDVSAYGRDSGTDLAALLGALCDLSGDFSVRVGMMNPATVLPILDDLAAAFADEKIFSFAHLPVQSGSDAVLAAMHRGYRAEDFETIVGTFRKRLADIRISTDCIVGFPGETDEDAAATSALLARTRPTKVNITRYSARPGTGATLLHDMPDWMKKNRSRALTRVAHALCDAENELFLGRELDVMVTERQRPGSCIARDRAYRNIVIPCDLPIGTRCRVVITGHKRHYLTGMPATGPRVPAR